MFNGVQYCIYCICFLQFLSTFLVIYCLFTLLKLSLDSLLQSNQKNGALGFFLFTYGPYQGLY